jgi:4-hydroxy-tetrahydrodipicolinate synthase
MTNKTRMGLSCALSTPFNKDGTIDLHAFSEHAAWTLTHGCDGVTVFGTTGEGASISTRERANTLSYMQGAGFDLGTQVTLGIAAATIEETVEQMHIGYQAGCRAILLAPPFYFPNASEDGLFYWYASVIESLGGEARDILLYHIPSMTRVGVYPSLVYRLKKAFPKVILGVKDSSGNGENTAQLLAENKDLQILVGDERQLAKAVRNGAAGSICGIANLCPAEMRTIAHKGRDNKLIHHAVDAVLVYDFMPAIKALLAHRTGYQGWMRMRPPLSDMATRDARKLVNAFEAIFASE